MELINFLKNNNDWETILSGAPYFIKIKRDGEYVMFSYNQLSSDFTLPIVRECRGIILHEKTLTPVCVPFFKFGNYGENYVPDIDWKSARTQEKVDGSIIKVWYHNEKWRLSTNGTINAYNSTIKGLFDLDIDCPYNNFGELFDKAKENCGLNYDVLDKNCTYMFELVSPYNKVVIFYKDIEIYHIGTRNNKTLQELITDIGVKKPKAYPLSTLSDCITAAEKLDLNGEGFVVCDKFFNRIKVKNPKYVACHHLKNNGDVNIASILELIRKNEIAEFLNYFPEYAKYVEKVQDTIQKIADTMNIHLADIKSKTFESQKEFALFVKNKPYNGYYFRWQKDNGLTPLDWLWQLNESKLKEYVISFNQKNSH